MEGRPFVTLILIGMNVAAFGAMVASGVSPTDPDLDSLLAMGANQGTLVVFHGEWWRTISSVFIHIGVLHLAVNMYSLWRVGAFVERLVGGPRFLIVYLLAGLGGAFASVLWNPISVSAGASGAIFGMFGFIVGFAIQARHLMPPDAAKSLWDGILGTIAINAFLAFSMPFLDNAAHLGGAAVGLLSGFVGTASAIERQGKGMSLGSQAIVLAAVIGLGVLAHVRTTNNPGARVAESLQASEAALKRGESQKAEALATEVLATDQNTHALYLRALARSIGGDLDGGALDANAAVEQLTGSGKDLQLGAALLLRAAFAESAGVSSDAERDLTRASALLPPDAMIVARRGYARVRTGADGGLDDARESLASPVVDPVWLNNLAWALVSRNQELELALKLADAAVAKESSAAAKGTRCWVRVELGQPELALPDCLAAAQSENGLLDRGMVAFIRQDYAEAVELWQQAAMKNPLDASDVSRWLERARAQLPVEDDAGVP